VRGTLGFFFAAVALAALPVAAFAQGIYTCVDAKGRRLTSDRPMIDCIDREQNEITPSGKVIRKIAPASAMEDTTAQEEKQRRAAEERNREIERKRRDRALLSRYPDRPSHDHERQLALASVDEITKAAQRQISQLQAERKKLDSELEFYKGDLARAPAQLKRRFEENQQQIAAQQRFIASKEEEKKRINARFDDELSRLKMLWGAAAAAAASAAKR
jgi:chromosome segregation ATPase